MGAAHVDIYRRVDPVQYLLEDRSDASCIYLGQTPSFNTATSEPQWQIWRITYANGILETKYANHGKYNCVWDTRTMYFDPCPAGGTPIPGATDTNVVTTPNIDILAMPVKDTEYSYTFPLGTKRFTLKNRGNGLIKLGFAVGETSTLEYFTIEPATTYGEEELAVSPLTLYFQSPSNSQTLEILSWS
jgi:hypothetical protein